MRHPGAYQLLFESADQLGIPRYDDEERWDLIRKTADLVTQTRRTADTETDALADAFRLWAAMHGIVSLRLHKPDVQWPGTLHDEVRDTVTRIVGATSR